MKNIKIIVIQVVLFALAALFGLVGSLPMAAILFLLALVPFIRLLFMGYSK